MDDRKKAFLILLAIASLMGLLVGLDIFADYGEGSSTKHLLIESVLLGVSLVTVVFSLQRLMQIRHENRELLIKVQSLNSEKDKWKNETRELVKGLSNKIEEQFGHWNLSHAETEVGFLLLKGFALKEIADLRGTKLKTVQQQSQSIYAKTNIANRSELSAFFLEDLLPPMKDREGKQ